MREFLSESQLSDIIEQARPRLVLTRANLQQVVGDVGRVVLLETLDELGIRDNTLIFYVWGDNGSSAEGQNGTISELLAQNGIATEIKDHIRTMNELGGMDVLGSPKADNMYHAGWAWAGSTPHRSTKLVAAHFGGGEARVGLVAGVVGLRAPAGPVGSS